MGIPRITSAIWVRVRITVTGDAHITRVLGMGMPTSMQHPLVRMVPTSVLGSLLLILSQGERGREAAQATGGREPWK